MNEMDVLRTEYSFFEIVMLKFGHFSMSINICLIIKFHKIIKVKTCFFIYSDKKAIEIVIQKKMTTDRLCKFSGKYITII